MPLSLSLYLYMYMHTSQFIYMLRISISILFSTSIYGIVPISIYIHFHSIPKLHFSLCQSKTVCDVLTLNVDDFERVSSLRLYMYLSPSLSPSISILYVTYPLFSLSGRDSLRRTDAKCRRF